MPARTYQLQTNDTLTNAWQTLPAGVTASAGGLVEYLDTTQPRPARRFYRLMGAP